MISIDEAIEKSKQKENISNGGSECYEFGDVVLVKYSNLLKYMKDGELARGSTEDVMEGVNIKADLGVNTPRHLGFKRVRDDEEEYCYVLQEKAKGINCNSFCKYVDNFEERKNSLEWVKNIPYEHYKKLVHDSCMVYEMGFESKPKNYFYDEETGFWLIDFLEYDKDHPFDQNNFEMLNRLVKYGYVPNIINIASSLPYDFKLTPEQEKQEEDLKNQI